MQTTERDGRVAFECEDIEAPITWSGLAVAVVARRCLRPAAPSYARADRVLQLVSAPAGVVAHVCTSAITERIRVSRQIG